MAADDHVARPPAGSNANPGTPELPVADIQRGMDLAVAGDTVVVAAGTCTEKTDFRGKNIRVRSVDPSDKAVVSATVIRFHPQGKWRADFAHVASRTLIEIEGGIFLPGGGRHNRGGGCARDAGKYLEAALPGRTVLRLTRTRLGLDFIERIVALLRRWSSSEETISRRNRRTE